jgi:hypothetical protein
VTTPEDQHRSLVAVRDAILHRYNDDAFERIIYSESHDEVANSRARVPQEVHPAEPGAGTPASGRHWPPPWSCWRRASPCSFRARSS